MTEGLSHTLWYYTWYCIMNKNICVYKVRSEVLVTAPDKQNLNIVSVCTSGQLTVLLLF